METERADHQIRIVADLGITDLGAVTAMIERAHHGQQTATPPSAIDTTAQPRESAWFSLLEAAQYSARRAADLLLHVQALVRSGVLLQCCSSSSRPCCSSSPVRRGWICAASIIYRQQRIGRYGQAFTMYKFRTMTPDRRRTRHPYTGPDRRKSHKTATDPRVTRTGKFLRRTSLDELPQLLQCAARRDEHHRPAPGVAGDRRQRTSHGSISAISSCPASPAGGRPTDAAAS